MGVNSWALMEDSFAMDGVMPPLWAYPDPIDELQQKLVQTTEEFNNFQLYANEKIKKQEEYIEHLFHCIQEKDEANNQLLLLLKKLMPPSPLQQQYHNSSITESDSISDTRNHQSYASSPVEYTSPDFSHINMADSCQMAGGVRNYDARIEQLTLQKPLPEKGKLMASIMEAGPLLRTLLIAGPLPRWKNQPKPMQPLTIPPIPINRSYHENSQGVKRQKMSS